MVGVGIAGKASLGLGRPVRYRNCSKEEAKTHFQTTPQSQWAAKGSMEIYELISKGFFSVLSSDVALLMFHKGLTVEEYFKNNHVLFNTLKKASNDVLITERSSDSGLLVSSRL